MHSAARWALAAARGCTSFGRTTRGFFFVSASYQGRSLLSAATELAMTVRESMGPERRPHLVTLFATPYEEWGAGLADMPQYLRHLLTYDGLPPPVVIGGVLRSIAAGPHLTREGGPCVALLAAHLPGVRIMPFNTTQGSLPALGGAGTWYDIVRASRAAAIAGAPPAGAGHGQGAAVPGGRAADGTIARGLGSGEGSRQQEEPGGGAGLEQRGTSGAAAAAAAVATTRAGTGAGEAPGAVGGRGRESGCRGSGDGGDVGPGVCSKSARQEGDCARRGGSAGGVAQGGQAGGGEGGEGRGRLSPLRQLCHHHQDYQHHQHQSQGQGQESAPGAGPVAAAGPGSGSGSGGAAGAGSAARVPGAAAAVGSAAAAPPPQSVAALLLSTPHFVEVEELLRRFGQVAPGMQVVGGVTSPGAWGDSESNWGAVWLNDTTHARGAVGCVLQGPFRLDTIVSPGFRGAGPVMWVTQAQGQYVLEVDGEPVHRPLQRAISAALNSGVVGTSLKIGVGEAGTATAPPNPPHQHAVHPAPHAAQQPPSPQQQRRLGATSPSSPLAHTPRAHPTPQHLGAAPPPQQQAMKQAQEQHPQQQRQLVTRNWFFQQGPPRPVLTVFSSGPIASGTPIQVHLQNYPAAHRDMRDRLRAYAERLPGALSASEGRVGALALSCSALPFFEGPDVERCLPGAAFAGGKVEGQFCSTVEGQPSRLHSFASCLAFLRAAQPDTSDTDCAGAPAAGAGAGAGAGASS